MADAKGRELGRSAIIGGDYEAAKALADAGRTGKIRWANIMLAAMAGHVPACLVTDIAPVETWEEAILTTELRLRMALAACKHIYPTWDLIQTPRLPRQWLEEQGGQFFEQMDFGSNLVHLHVKYENWNVAEAVSREKMMLAYPGWSINTVWAGMVDRLRRGYYKDTGKLIEFYPHISHRFKAVEAYLAGKNVNLKAHWIVQFGTPAWLTLLLQVAWVSDAFERCIDQCNNFDDNVLEVMNKEVIAWTLKTPTQKTQ